MLPRLCSVGCLVSLCLTVVVLPAQSPQDPQQPVFRGGVTVVNVDTYSSTNTAIDGKYRRIEVKVTQPKVSVAARRGYLAPSAETRAAAAAKAAAAAVPATIAEELARLSRLRTDTELLTYGVRSATGIGVVAEISSQEMARGGWSAGADVRVALNRPNGENITPTGHIEPAARGTIVHVPLAGGESGP